MNEGYQPEDVVTVIRLVSLGRASWEGAESAIVAAVGQASRHTEGNSIFLVARNESVVRHIEVGDIVQWVAEPFGVVWLAEQRADDADVPELGDCHDPKETARIPSPNRGSSRPCPRNEEM